MQLRRLWKQHPSTYTGGYPEMNKQQHNRAFTAYRCRNCGRLSYPRHERCPSCKHMELEEFEIKKEGILLAYTKVYVTPAGVEDKPLILGIVDLGEGVRALGQILADEPRIGMKLKPAWGVLRRVAGKEYSGFRFVPV
ncbi:MAG TPA: Zn-ribbon domain-containing OB-fold protein [Candidatus Caldiarchaeum subterraneum]|uniref:Zn-ribbon domain-containing OB-fold protein n=1 Tax=Caldiarchaeum subterraneum TaxID=311458 RepID=A0A832ZUH7_CALS0|nr:Zn-ribbon domain-containing OB-fold protein [Candidatus Caldarchaeum subterraneum]